MEKRCIACGRLKPTLEFHKDKSKADGLNTYCKVCHIARQKTYLARPPRRETPEGTKRCTLCKSVKPSAEFHRLTGTYDGLDKRCKACSHAHHTAWAKSNPEKNAALARKWRAANPGRSADHSLKKNYDIPIGTYDSMFAQQNGCCAICSTKTPGGKGRFHVDHCHDTKVVRGLLCHHCNIGIGNLKHRKDLLLAAVNYLRRSTESSVES